MGPKTMTRSPRVSRKPCTYRKPPLVSLKSRTRWSRYELPPITVNKIFPGSVLTLVCTCYLEIHCLPCSPFPRRSWLVGWLVCILLYLQGISLQAAGEDMGGGLGAEAEACHPALRNTGNTTPALSRNTRAFPFSTSGSCRMQGGLSFSTPLRSYPPFLVWGSMRQVMEGKWGSRVCTAGERGILGQWAHCGAGLQAFCFLL